LKNILCIVLIAIVVIALQVPALWAQDVISYDYMIEPSQADTLFWEGTGDITRRVLIDMVEFQKNIIFDFDKYPAISVDWENGSKILSSLEKVINSNGIPSIVEVVLFYFEKGGKQRYIYYEYDTAFFPKESLKDNFLLYFDYCENNISNETLDQNFFNLKMRPETVFCTPKMEDLSFLNDYENFRRLLPLR